MLANARFLALVAAQVLVALSLFPSALAQIGGLQPLTEKQQARAVTDAIGHHSFTPPLLQSYYGEGDIPHWTLSGSTVITDHYVRLTPDAASTTGHFWNSEPLDMDAFEIVIGYRVMKQTPGNSADGFAMWLTTEPPRSEGPLFGHPMSFVGAGILFDTYDNDNMKDNPMVSLIYNTPEEKDRKYNPARDFRGETKGHCVFDYRNIIRPRLATARVRYNSGHVEVYLSKDGENSEKLCFVADNIHLDTGNVKYYLGLTANTGGVSANHDIVFLHLSPLAGHSYTHDIHETRVPAYEENVAFRNYQRDPTPSPEEEQRLQQEQQQQVREEQQQTPPPPPPPPPQEQQYQQQQQQQQPPPPPPPPPQQQQQQYQQPPPPPPPPQQQYQQPPPPPPQQQYPDQQQQQQYQQPPPPPPPQQQQQQAANDDAARLEHLERELAALRRRQNPPPPRRDDEDWFEDEDETEYYDDRGTRRRRARTNRGRRDY